MEFQEGDLVMISSKSSYYEEDTVSNPRDMAGVVYEVAPRDYLPVKVKWNNGEENSYNHTDLKYPSDE